MSTRAELRADVEAVVEAAQGVISAVADGDYTSAQQFEADANAIRATIGGLIDELYGEWGVEAAPAVRALRSLGAHLLRLRAGLTDDVETVNETIDRVVSLPELADRWYGEPGRWPELAALNPGIRHPGFVQPGTVVVRHGQ